MFLSPASESNSSSHFWKLSNCKDTSSLGLNKHTAPPIKPDQVTRFTRKVFAIQQALCSTFHKPHSKQADHSQLKHTQKHFNLPQEIQTYWFLPKMANFSDKNICYQSGRQCNSFGSNNCSQELILRQAQQTRKWI